MVNGVASEVEDFFDSCPLTPEETTVPIRIPTARVARIRNMDARRCARNRVHKALTRESIR
jgi:hypothetical protein